MNRDIFTANHGSGKLRHVVRISESGAVDGQPGFAVLMTLLRTLCDQPDLLRHGNDCPESLKAFRDGSHWVVEATTIVDR